MEQLEEFFASIGEPSYRAKQMMKWMYLRGESDFSTMSDFGKKLRDKLSLQAYISNLEIVSHLISSDGETEKFIFRLSDGLYIESVLMSYEERIGPSRLTACISTQAGCPMACSFCATGRAGFFRNLSAGEIVDQIIRMQKVVEPSQRRIANIVMMGMGEPFLNYDNVFDAVRILNHGDSIAIGIRHITISTCGIVPAIERLADEKLAVKLAVSLHSPFDEVRSSLMPINKKYPLALLMNSLHKYQEKTNKRITFEYALIKNVNDSLKDARELSALLKGLSAFVNLIPLNPVNGFDFRRSSDKDIEEFQKYMEKSGIKTTVRKEMGSDINAACGQLRDRFVSDMKK